MPCFSAPTQLPHPNSWSWLGPASLTAQVGIPQGHVSLPLASIFSRGTALAFELSPFLSGSTEGYLRPWLVGA